MNILRLGFLASYGGSSAIHIIKACRAGQLDAKACVLISNNSNSLAIKRAREIEIPTAHISTVTHPVQRNRDHAISLILNQYQVNLIILSGYMKKLGTTTLTNFAGRILNVHPSLLPRYGGRGMFGNAVHEAVLAAGEVFTGVTIHLVDEEYDRGAIVAQSEVLVLREDKLEILRKRVLKEELRLYLDTLQKIRSGEIDLKSITK